MSKLQAELNSYADNIDKFEFIYKCFTRLKEKVDKVLLFGKSNSPTAEKTADLYYKNNNRNQFFPINYSQRELDVLPAVIADNLRFNDEDLQAGQQTSEPYALFFKYFKDAYLYGTGTCENYAIVGAYMLATEFSDIKLSIETLYSDQSHTYIRVHTTPEYIFDFWGDFVCEYTDTLTWNECAGEFFPRNNQSSTETNIIFLNRAQLINLAENIFSEENEKRRLNIINQVNTLLNKEQQLEKNTLEAYRIGC
ncbi:hypothetical protein ACNVED_04250 [Legionella sp. D16C41]|uniref:hypothetical protein n=1 Tax=Legionella sp. D16C41 TaxID=3402688 RepID=UPI003AF5CDB1